MLPTELMKAIPPAAAAEPRKAVGRFQNTGSEPEIPKLANEKAAMASHGLMLRNIPASTQPAPPKRQGTVKCHTRSPVRSERREKTTMPITPRSAGIEEM